MESYNNYNRFRLGKVPNSNNRLCKLQHFLTPEEALAYMLVMGGVEQNPGPSPGASNTRRRNSAVTGDDEIGSSGAVNSVSFDDQPRPQQAAVRLSRKHAAIHVLQFALVH